MKMATVKLSNAELNMLVTLLTDNEREGSYYGNREQWENRRVRVMDRLMRAESAA